MLYFNFKKLLIRYFNEIDKEKKGFVTYWDLFLSGMHDGEILMKFVGCF